MSYACILNPWSESIKSNYETYELSMEFLMETIWK